MTAAKPRFSVSPELCEGCRPGNRDCERACTEGAIRVGTGYVMVDWDKCTGCLECVEMCEAGALRPYGTTPAAPSPTATAPVPGAPASPRRQAPASVAGDVAGAAASGAADTSATALREAPPDAGTSGANVRPLRPQASPESDMRVWTQMDALLVLMLMLGSLVALNQVLDLEVVTLMPRSGQVVARSAGLTVTYCLELALIALLASRHGVSFGSSLGMRPVARSIKSAAVSSLLVVALLVAARLLTAVYGYVSQQFGWEPVFEWGGDLTQVFGRGWAGLSLTLVLVVFLGPFVEELAFRGVVQSAARRRWGMWASIATTSLIFAVYHFDPWMFVPTFVLSLALGWLAENRRGLWPSIATHVLYNGVTVAAAFWFVAEQGTRV